MYHFPAVGFQMAVYMARLLRHGVGSSMAEAHTADMRVRELVATRPQQSVTTVDFDHVAAWGPATPTLPRRSKLATNSVRRDLQQGLCCIGPVCPWGSVRPPL